MRLTPRTTQACAKFLLLAACALTLALLLGVVGFVLHKGVPHVSWTFLTASIVDMGRSGGILPAIVGTCLTVVVSLSIAAPLGIASAIYLAEYTREGQLTRIIRFGINCLAGVPSIIFGLFGYIVFVNLFGFGWSVLSGGLSLATMILPTVIRTAEEALRAVPTAHRDVAAALGATRWQVVSKTVLPYALPGILTGLILGMGRAIEETAVVIFTAGSAMHMPSSIFDSARTMAVHFYILAREGISNSNAYATAAVLIGTVVVLNSTAYLLMYRLMKGRRCG